MAVATPERAFNLALRGIVRVDREADKQQIGRGECLPVVLSLKSVLLMWYYGVMRNQTNSPPPVGRIRRIMDYLVSRKSETHMPSLFYALLLLTPLSRTAMTFLCSPRWQISGYYLDGLQYGLFLLLGVAWILSIILLLGKKEFKRGGLRLVATPAILVLGCIVALIPMLFLPSTVSGWPSGSVYSPGRSKHFILAEVPATTDVIYQVYSTRGSRLNPVWQVAVPMGEMDYSEDGSLTEDPHLILSEDEQLLVVARGGQLTDAILIDQQQSLTQIVFCMDDDRQQQWERRTETIRRLLAAHAGPMPQSVRTLTDPEIKATLNAWCERIAADLTQTLSDGRWQVSCSIKELGSAANGSQEVWYEIACTKGDAEHELSGNMVLVQDRGRLVITKQETGSFGAQDDGRRLSDRMRTAMEQLAPPGTYLDGP